MSKTVFLSLGSNLGNREDYLQRAIELLTDTGSVEAVSSIYQTAAWGKTDQADFLNLVVKLQTKLSAKQLLKRLHEIEASLERVRLERWGPRTIDIDILLYGNEVIAEPDLEVPHPRMMDRAFVLIPLLDLAPEMELKGQLLRDRLLDLKDQTVTLYEPSQADCE